MSTQGKIKTLYSDREQTEAIFPRTTTNAIFDEDGVGLEAILSTTVHAKEEFENNSEVTLNDADTFGGNTPDYFASTEDLQEVNSRIDTLVFPVKSVNLKTGNVTLTAADVGAVTEAFVKNEIANAKLDNSGSGVDLSGYVTKDEFQAIDFPVDSVNGKTGEITLTAADIGALNLLNITDNDHKVPEGADLNTYTTPGAYRIATAAISASLVNAPSYTSAGGRLIVSGLSGTAGVFQFIVYNTTYLQMWARVQNNSGSWSNWFKIYTQYDVIPVEDGGTGATDAATARTNLGITPANIGAAASSHNHSTTNITSGTLGIARGGTGRASLTANSVLTGNGTSAVNQVATASGALFATAANGAAKFGTLPFEQGGTNSTSRLGAAKALTNEAVSSPNYFVSLTNSWGKFGYTSITQAKTSLGLTPAMVFGTEYATNERWNNGKTVYVKAVNLGTLSNKQVDAVYRIATGYTSIVDLRTFGVASNLWLDLSNQFYFNLNSNYLIHECKSDMSAYTGYAVIKYVK